MVIILSISKKGNKQLRCLLYLAVTCNIRLKKVNPINQFYQKKRQQLNPLNSKAAKVACTAKLAKIIYGMCKNNTIFQRYPIYIIHISQKNGRFHLFVVDK